VGQYKGSGKIADLTIEFRNAAGKLEPKFVVEVGFSEEYKDLVQSVKFVVGGYMWSLCGWACKVLRDPEI
jgi:hypothetical protein